jgi:hypothetical protein
MPLSVWSPFPYGYLQSFVCPIPRRGTCWSNPKSNGRRLPTLPPFDFGLLQGGRRLHGVGDCAPLSIPTGEKNGHHTLAYGSPSKVGARAGQFGTAQNTRKWARKNLSKRLFLSLLFWFHAGPSYTAGLKKEGRQSEICWGCRLALNTKILMISPSFP